MDSSNLTFAEYQGQANELATYPQVGSNLIYPALGLAGESGEAADKVKKTWRNQGLTSANGYSESQKLELAKEISDVLWYIAALAMELGIPMEEIALMNLAKLHDRRARNVINSEGDNR
jgi:NTP pyrophosphatase (non-canonical NTP hydrolase)